MRTCACMKLAACSSGSRDAILHESSSIASKDTCGVSWEPDARHKSLVQLAACAPCPATNRYRWSPKLAMGVTNGVATWQLRGQNSYVAQMQQSNKGAECALLIGGLDANGSHRGDEFGEALRARSARDLARTHTCAQRRVIGPWGLAHWESERHVARTAARGARLDAIDDAEVARVAAYAHARVAAYLRVIDGVHLDETLLEVGAPARGVRGGVGCGGVDGHGTATFGRSSRRVANGARAHSSAEVSLKATFSDEVKPAKRL